MRGLLLLLSALLLLESTVGNKEYHQLTQQEKNIVDKAIEKANDFGNKHLDFAHILSSDSEKDMINVLLKSTSCDRKTPPHVHQRECTIQHKSKPQVSCVHCHGEMSCFLLKDIDKIKQAINRCSPVHRAGGAHMLFQKGGNEQQTGCLGCI